jgi:hypothetical protein
MSSISVSVKPILRKSLRETEAVRELKSSAWPDMGEASEGQLPQQVVPLVGFQSKTLTDIPSFYLTRIVGQSR